MDDDTATRFVSSLVKSIQALCNGYIDFSSSIEVVGHIHLNIDRSLKFDYVLTEEVSKSISEGATVFASHSYHSQPPPSVSSKTSNDVLNQNRRKSQVNQNDENDPMSIGSLPSEVPNTSKSESHNHSASHVGDSSDSSQSNNFNISQDSVSTKQENSRSSCQVQDSLDRRRRNTQLQRTLSPAAKRSRSNDSGSNSGVQNPSFDVIEIKEEPEEEPSVYFGDNLAGGQDIQTPDFSNVVMESLDRVGQIEGTQLVAGGDGMQMQQQPFPVMLHTNSGMPSSTLPSSAGSVAGPSSDLRTAASASGVVYGAQALLGTKYAGERQQRIMPSKHPLAINRSMPSEHPLAINLSLGSSSLTLGSNYAPWTPLHINSKKLTHDITITNSISESEELERIRIRRERVRLRVQAHRARKRAAQQAERNLAEQLTNSWKHNERLQY